VTIPTNVCNKIRAVTVQKSSSIQRPRESRDVPSTSAETHQCAPRGFRLTAP
jgi:hypothetical protein